MSDSQNNTPKEYHENHREATFNRYLDWLGVDDDETLCLVAIGARLGKRGFKDGGTSSIFGSRQHLIQALEDEDHQLQSEGVYLLPGVIHPDVLARELPTSWTAGAEQPKDVEIIRRRVVVVDCDPNRLKKISSTKEELGLAGVVARNAYERLGMLLGSEESLAIARSGNGYHVLIAVDLPTGTDGRTMGDPGRELVERFLLAMAALHQTARVTVDRSVVEARRIFPAYGSRKRKGANRDDRPWRATTFQALERNPPRLGLEEFTALVELVESGVTPEHLERTGIKVEKAKVQQPRPSSGGRNRLEECAGIDVVEVYRRLGYDPERPKCLECGHEGSRSDTSVKVLTDKNVVMCLHDTCARAALGPLKLVSKVLTGEKNFKGTEPTKKILGWFEDQGLIQPEERKRGRPTRVYTDEQIASMGSIDDDILGGDPENENAKKTRNQTDAGNAERLLDLHGQDIRYIKKWKKWIVWNGQRWVLDDNDHVELRRLTKEVARSMCAEAKAIENAVERREMVKWAQTSESDARQEAMIKSAKHMCAISHDELNVDRWLLNTPSGTVDLRTGELREHRREDLITQMTRVPYDPLADRTLVDTFLAKSQPDPEMRGYLWRLQGYAASGDIEEHVFAIHYGSGVRVNGKKKKGRNGKGTLLNSCMEALGDYADAIPPEVTMGLAKGQHPTGLSTLYGLRYALGPETEERAHLNVSQCKTLSGGDPVKTRRMNEDHWTFQPTHLIQQPTNYKPLVKAPASDPIWERLHLVPWLVHLEKGERDKSLPRKLKKDPGLLRAIVEGCVDYHRLGGLHPPKAVTDAIEEYRQESDTIGRFINDCLDLSDVTAKITNADLYTSYKAWCEQEGIHPLSRENLSKALNEEEIGEAYKSGSAKGRRGVRLMSRKEDDEVVEEEDDDWCPMAGV